MAEFPALPLWTDAYIADTTHLSDAEHGRYLLMLMHLWRTPNKKFPNDDAWLARKFGRTADEIRELFRPLIAEFFKSTGNWLYQARINREFSRVQAVSQRASARRSARHNAMKENANYSDSACSTAPVEQPDPDPEPVRKKEKDSLTGVQKESAAASPSLPSKPAAVRGSRLPEGWTLSADDRDYARSRGLSFEATEAMALDRSEEHTSELQSRPHLVCRLLLEKKKKTISTTIDSKTKNKKYTDSK